jgi:hypothetical protein
MKNLRKILLGGAAALMMSGGMTNSYAEGGSTRLNNGMLKTSRRMSHTVDMRGRGSA